MRNSKHFVLLIVARRLRKRAWTNQEISYDPLLVSRPSMNAQNSDAKYKVVLIGRLRCYEIDVIFGDCCCLYRREIRRLLERHRICENLLKVSVRSRRVTRSQMINLGPKVRSARSSVKHFFVHVFSKWKQPTMDCDNRFGVLEVVRTNFEVGKASFDI